MADSDQDLIQKCFKGGDLAHHRVHVGEYSLGHDDPPALISPLISRCSFASRHSSYFLVSELHMRAEHHVEKLEKIWLGRLEHEDISRLVESVLTDFKGIEPSFLDYVNDHRHAITFGNLQAICKNMTPYDKFLVCIISETGSTFLLDLDGAKYHN